MNNDLKIEKLQRFINDEAMAFAVHQTLIDSFLKKRTGQDVYLLAASRLAVDFLNEAWKELESYKVINKKLSPTTRQVGL